MTFKSASFLFALLLGGFAQAQMRLIPHLTRPDGGFATEVILANTGDFAESYTLTGYDEAGSQTFTASGRLEGRATLYMSPESLFGTDAVAHFTIDAADAVRVSVTYRANREGSGPAHVGEANETSLAWRVYAGNPDVTWDGIAAVNMGSAATSVRVRHVGADGNEANTATVIEDLLPRGKGLYVFSTDFDASLGGFFEVSGSQPLAIIALRGNQGADFLWENRATPFTQAAEQTAFALENAFPGAFFNGPLDLRHAGDGSNRLFVVTIEGRIHVLDLNEATPTRNTFMNISGRVSTGGEMGLLGVAFHPDFANNGFFYVNYATQIGGPRRTVISRFQVSGEDPNAGDPDSELILLETNQPAANHNGGQLVFGPDGYLYIALGDGGGAGDSFQNGQELSTLLGSILRIDVDQPAGGLNYGIPAGNPFVGNAQARPEIYAYGLRNPWRFSFDGDTLWAADVGQDAVEEINWIQSGGNYGWNTMEGTRCFNPPNGCNQSGLALPVFEYPHTFGNTSITGGYVYRGANLPMLYGAYVYADFISGRVWALWIQDGEEPLNELLIDFDPDRMPAAFGVDQSGELYLCSIAGMVFRFALEP